MLNSFLIVKAYTKHLRRKKKQQQQQQNKNKKTKKKTKQNKKNIWVLLQCLVDQNRIFLPSFNSKPQTLLEPAKIKMMFSVSQ